MSRPDIYYHVTSYRNWPSIRDNGLRPGGDGHVWLFTNAERAMLFKDAWDSSGWATGIPPTEWRVPPCIVVVRTDRAVPTEAGIPGAYWVEGPITKAEVYEVIRPEDLHHYRTARIAAEDYHGGHRAPTGGDDVAAPMHDVEEMMPDYYARPNLYSHDRGPVDRECERAIKAVRGKPDAMVTIYRALPPGYTTINTGDWVTPSLTYARGHAMQSNDPSEDWPVISAQVPARTLWTEGYAAEWGYSGPRINARLAKKIAARWDLVSRGDPMGGGMVWEARDGGVLAGYLSYDSSRDPVKIKALEVNPAYQRQGVGTWLLKKFIDTWGLEEIDPGEFTEAGAALWTKVTGLPAKGTTRMTLPNDRDWRYAVREAAAVPADLMGFMRHTPAAMQDRVRSAYRAAEEALKALEANPTDETIAAAERAGEDLQQALQALTDAGLEPQIAGRVASLAQRLVQARSDQDYSDFVMIALRPPKEVLKVFADMDECTEDIDDLHLTLYYLGTKAEAGGEAGRERLMRGCYDFSLHSGYRGLTGMANGFGCFMNDDSNVLVALWDIPGIAEFRTYLMDAIKRHRYQPRQDNHGFTPHMTLAYDEQQPFLQLPRLPEGNPDRVTFGSIWVVWGDDWTEVTLP